MRIYIPQKITITVKNRLHSRQQPCRSPRQTVIGIGLRELFCQKVRLPSVRAARRHCRCLAFRLFYFILCLFSVYTFFMRNPWFALSRHAVCAICLRIKRPHYDTAYAAVEPCRRQRPERSEDAAREQAAEGRMAKRFRPGKKTDETASDMTRDLNC